MSTGILAIDPGQERSGVVLFDSNNTIILSEGSMHNDEVIRLIQTCDYGVIVCEIMSAIRQSVGLDTFQTCYMIGRIMEAADYRTMEFVGIEARQVKKHHIGTVSGKPSLVSQAIIRRYAHGNTDKKAAKKISCGTSKNPGPLFGVTDHAWSALAVGLCYLDQKQTIKEVV